MELYRQAGEIGVRAPGWSSDSSALLGSKSLGRQGAVMSAPMDLLLSGKLNLLHRGYVQGLCRGELHNDVGRPKNGGEILQTISV